jgi:glycolate oxidase FAD binding subunit
MIRQPPWLPSLTALLGPSQIDTAPEDLQAHVVDGRRPSVVVFPETLEQAAAVLQWAQREALAVLPQGAGTQITLGGIPTRADVVLSTRRLQSISEYDAANFTLTAQAGVPFAAIARLTADNLQTLPLQYDSSRATLGGLIATNAGSPKRLLYGGIRDLLLGIRVALPNSEIVHFGGKVVKNVAGYDMAKLFLGSLGTFGVIVEATFKLHALPERDETLLAILPTLPQAAAVATQMLETHVLPSQILVLTPTAAQAIVPWAVGQRPGSEPRSSPPQLSSPPEAESAMRGALLLVNVEGMHEAVERQLRDISNLCQGRGAAAVEVLVGERQGQLRQRLAAMTQAHAGWSPPPPPMISHEEAGGASEAIIVRLGTLPSRVPMVMEAIAQSLHPIVPHVCLVGDCGVGEVRLALRGAYRAMAGVNGALVQALHELPELVSAEGGYVVIEAAPAAVKERLDVWGLRPPAFNLLKALKAKFDPGHMLNPGRFIGGL